MRRPLLFMLAAAVIAGCGSSDDQGQTAAPTPSTGSADVEFPTNCDSGLTQEPSHVIVTCADQGITVEDIQWQSWGADTAVGNGTAQVNDCQPDCVSGKVRTYDEAQVKLTGIDSCNGAQQYTSLALSFEGKVPPGSEGTLTEKFPCA